MKRASIESRIQAVGGPLVVLALLVLLVSALAMYGCKTDPSAITNAPDEASASGSLDNPLQQSPAHMGWPDRPGFTGGVGCVFHVDQDAAGCEGCTRRVFEVGRPSFASFDPRSLGDANLL